MEEQCTQGTFVPRGRQDILTTAIGRPEHPGRVRGVGVGVGIRQYFGPPTQHTHSSSMSQEELTQLEQKLTEKLTPAITARVQEEFFRLFPALASMVASQQVHENPSSAGTMGSTSTAAAPAPAPTPTPAPAHTEDVSSYYG